MDQCSAAKGVTKFKRAENEACNRSFGKCIFIPCGDSRMGTEFRFLLGRYTIRNDRKAIKTKGIPLHYTSDSQ